MPAEARDKETRILAAIADYDGRVRRGIEAIRAAESTSALLSTLGTGQRKADKDEAALLRALPNHGSMEFTRAVDTTTGKPVIARTLYSQLLAEAVERSTVMKFGATPLNTAGGEPIDIAVVTGRSKATITSENGNITESQPTAVLRPIGAYKYAYASVISSEFVTDQTLDLIGFIVEDAGPAIGHGMGEHFLVGTGTGQPKGIVTAGSPATATWQQGAKDTVVSDALIDLHYELQASYRSRATYVVSDMNAAVLRKAKDLNGQYLWVSALTAGAPDMFNGRPLVTDVAMPDNKILFADLAKYKTRLAGPLRVERSVDVKFMSDQVVYRFIQRADGLLADERAAKVLTITPKP